MWNQMMFQDACSPGMYVLDRFHDKSMVIIVFIVTYVSLLLSYFISNNVSVWQESTAHELEMVWTLYPAGILAGLALPSLRILYLLDDVSSPVLSVKIMGHQWYWSYGLGDANFDSYMVRTEDLEIGAQRLLEVDNRLVVPVEMNVRALISSSDVLHSWAVPSLGLKADAVPGRLNQVALSLLHPGLYYGQCSEICGANHSFMPICVEGVLLKDWVRWANFS